jgi:predicted GIY-YIG superfamily endonuclease
MLIQMQRKWIASVGVLIQSYHETVDLAISQEDAMKRVQNAKKRKVAFNSNSKGIS